MDDEEFELRSVSVRLDGRASIEHQIDIHVTDLVESAVNPDISLSDVLAGLEYVMDYRIRGDKMPNLDQGSMDRLATGLLQTMGSRTGNLLGQKFTPEADVAFKLFGAFLQEVIEFQTAISVLPASELQFHLMLHKRAVGGSKEEREFTAAVVALVLAHSKQVSDPKELTRESDGDLIDGLMKEFPEKFQVPDIGEAKVTNPFPPQALYFDKNAEALAQMFSSDTRRGLPSSRIEAHRKHYGPNHLPSPPKPSIISMIWTQMTDFMIVILILVAIIDFATGEKDAGIALLAVVVVNATIGFYQEFKANMALEALMSLNAPKATVIRDGNPETVSSSDLVPGDLVALEEGDVVPADLRLCDISQLELIEAILTGESLPVTKSIRTIRQRGRKIPLVDCKSNAFMSTSVARGRGKGIVVRSGNSSEIGRISQAICSTPHVKTSLEKNLGFLAKVLVGGAVVLCVIIILIGIGYKKETKETVMLGISLAVSVIPESLVAVVTVAMSLGVGRMSKKNAIVRKLPAVESLGSVTVICSDKTGTLTEGKMGASELWTCDSSFYTFTESTKLDPEAGCINQSLPSPTNPSEKTDAQVPKSIDAMSVHLVASMMTATLCNNSTIYKDEETKAWKTTGDPTEVAMEIAAQKAGLSRTYFQDTLGFEKIGEFPFDSDRKMMSVIYQQNTAKIGQGSFGSGFSLVLAKGAPEGILKSCTGYLEAPSTVSTKRLDDIQNFTSQPMTDDLVERISKQSSEMASRGLRVLAYAVRKVSSEEASGICQSKKDDKSECELSFVGLIGLIDPPKKGVRESVGLCHKAGIKVIMITGDHISTATAIAKKLTIVDPNEPGMSHSMEGYQVDLVSEEFLSTMRPFPTVFARVSPDNKLKIIKALQRRGDSVAMTGDGVNDAPAIKKADVGVAMGINGTEITKQAADIVLADDNFTTIVDAVMEGRLVYDNIKKFCVYILTCNSSEVILFFIVTCINLPPAFGMLPILWANIIADIPPALSLGLEPAEADIMERRPRPVNESVITWPIALLVFFQGMSIALISLGVYMTAIQNPSWGAVTVKQQQSLTFAALVSMQLVHSFLSKSVTNSLLFTGVLNNLWMIFAFFISFGLLVLGLYQPDMAHWLEFEFVTGVGWGIVFISCAIHIINVELLKTAYRRFMIPYLAQTKATEKRF